MNQEDKWGLVLSATMFVGALIGIGLNFTVLSPLAIGGIVSFSSIVIFLILVPCLLRREVLKDKKTLILGCIRTIGAPVLVIVFGVTLGDIVNSDVMLGMWIAMLNTTIIGMIGRIFPD